MRVPAVLATALAAASLAAVPPPAHAAKLFHEKFSEEFSEEFNCEGTPVRDEVTVRGHVSVNLRQGVAYFVEHVQGTAVHTNLVTGGTYTEVFTTTSHDHDITDNGDGTLTITVYASGTVRFYDQFGTYVLKDPGQARFAFDVFHNGTLDNPEDDTDVPDSFRIVRPSTGNSDFSDRNFCDDLRTYTSAP